MVDPNEAPKQAPAMSLATLRAIEEIATNKSVTPYKRAYADGIFLMIYASLRFSDVQRIRSFECNEDAVHGTLLNCKTKKQHGQHWPWACPQEGITGSREWAEPLVDMRTAYRKINGAEPTFTFMRLGRLWQLVPADAAPYATTRRKLALICVALGDTEGETYTIHSPKNLLPTAANQLKFDKRELNIMGHWSSTSKMPERYDRSACANELLLRNTVIHRMREGWNIAPAPQLPGTVTDTNRIGRDKGIELAVGETAADVVPTKTDSVLKAEESQPLTQREAESSESSVLGDKSVEDTQVVPTNERMTRMCGRLS